LDRITLFYTKDGGHTWQKTELVVSISTPQQVYPIDIISFTFLNAQTGWLLRSTGGGTGENASGGYMPPGTSEEIADWWGVIKSNPPGAQYDDYFERQDLGQAIYFGFDSLAPVDRLPLSYALGTLRNRRGYAAATWQKKWFSESVVLL
jgi:hypothetical protein